MTLSSTVLDYWALDPTTPGKARLASLLSCAWSLDLGDKASHWDLYAQYTQPQLRQEIQSHWEAWQTYKPTAQYTPWLWAVKVYLWRFPLDTQFAEEFRQSMGPVWLLHVRHNDDDWAWLAKENKNMPLDTLVRLLSVLPAHAVGNSLVLDIPPLFEGLDTHWFDSNDTESDELAREPSCLLLRRYAHTLLSADTHFYPRWRAFLICLNNSVRAARRKKKGAFPHIQIILEKTSMHLGLTPRTLWKGYDEKWIAFTKNKECLSLKAWDELVREFQAPADWRARLLAMNKRT